MKLRLNRLVARSLIARLVFSFLGVSVAMVLAVAVIAYHQARTALQQEVVERLRTVADSKEKQLGRWVDAQRIEVEYLARLSQRHLDGTMPAAPAGPGVRVPTNTTLTGFLRRSLTRKTDFRELFVLSVPGARVIASSDSSRIGDYRVTDEYFLEGRTRTYVQRVYPSAAPPEGTPTLTIATPVRDSAGRTVAVLAAHLDLSQIDSVTADRSGLGSTGEAYFTDRFRVFVSSTRFGRPDYPRGVPTVGVTRAAKLRQSGDAAYDDYRGVPVLGVYRWIESQDLALIVEMNRDEAFAPARRLLGAIVLTGIFSSFVLAALICLTALRIARPIKAIALTAERVADGDFTAVAPVLTRDEIGRLARAFNRMTTRIRRLYEGQQQQVDALGRAAAALEENRAVLQAIIDNTTAFIMLTDMEGEIVLVNRAFTELIGQPPERVLGRTAIDVVPGLTAERRSEIAAEVLATGRPVVAEEEFFINGEVRYALLSRFLLRGASGEPYALCSVANEITGLKQAEEERRQFAQQLQHTQKLESLGVLAGGIAHDFNNLLTAILGHAGLVLRSLPGDSRSVEDVQLILQAARRAADMTNQMLAYAGRAKFRIGPVDLNGLVTQMSQLLQLSISKKVELRYVLAPDLPTIEGDPAQLQQVVMNLITNAAEAVGDQPGTISLRTDLLRGCVPTEEQGGIGEASHGADCIRLIVTDTGAGMDEETMARIFEPFFTTKFTGRGLGLASVQGIVRGHHGSLTVQSTVGQGTTFTAIFPAAVTAPESVASLPAAKAGRVGGSGTVLVVDDEASIRRVAQRALELSGYRVILAEDGARALEVYREQGAGIDLVLLDLTMPVMDGTQVYHELHRIDPAVRIVLSSGFTEHDLTSRGHTLDAVFLQKPYLWSELVETIQDTLAGRDATSGAAT